MKLSREALNVSVGNTVWYLGNHISAGIVNKTHAE